MKKTTTKTTSKSKKSKSVEEKKEILSTVQELKLPEVSNIIEEMKVQSVEIAPVIQEIKESIFETTIFSTPYQEEIYVPRVRKQEAFVEL